MSLTKAEIEIYDEEKSKTINVIPIMFNPSEYKISKQAHYDKDDIFAGYSQITGYSSIQPKTLSLELFFNYEEGYSNLISDFDNEGVSKYTDELLKLTDRKDDNQLPCCIFKWGKLSFKGYVTSIDENFTRFNEQGIPIRAVVNLTIEEKIDIKNSKNKLKDKSTFNYVDNLCDLADNPEEWRKLAKKMQILNPRLMI